MKTAFQQYKSTQFADALHGIIYCIMKEKSINLYNILTVYELKTRILSVCLWEFMS